MSIKASADEVEITKVSAFTARSFFGDTIPAKYYISSQPTSFNFEYYGSYTSPGVGLNVDSSSMIPTPAGMVQYDFVIYKGVGLPSQGVVDVSIDDFYLRFGDYARGGFALSTYLNGVQSNWNNAVSYPNNHCGSFPAVRADSGASAALADYYGVMYFQFISGYNAFNFRPIYYSFDNGGVMDSLEFSGIYPNYSSSDNSGVIYLCVICPYIGSSMSGQPPAETTTTETSSGGVVTTGDISVDVNIDLDETNGILGDILSVLSDFVGDIIDGIEGLFVPDEDYLENWLADLIDLFEDKFGSTGIDITPLKDALLDMATYGATTSIRFPGIDLYSCGIPFYIPPRAVQLQPFGSPIDTYIELSVNIAATLAVFNLLFTKIKAILVGERVVEIEGDDE